MGSFEGDRVGSCCSAHVWKFPDVPREFSTMTSTYKASHIDVASNIPPVKFLASSSMIKLGSDLHNDRLDENIHASLARGLITCLYLLCFLARSGPLWKYFHSFNGHFQLFLCTSVPSSCRPCTLCVPWGPRSWKFFEPDHPPPYIVYFRAFLVWISPLYLFWFVSKRSLTLWRILAGFCHYRWIWSFSWRFWLW